MTKGWPVIIVGRAVRGPAKKYTLSGSLEGLEDGYGLRSNWNQKRAGVPGQVRQIGLIGLGRRGDSLS